MVKYLLVEDERFAYEELKRMMQRLRPSWQLAGMLDRDVFFRVSRSCISNIRSIRKSSRYFGSRLKLYFEPECPHEVLVSRSRVADFLKWVDGVV